MRLEYIVIELPPLSMQAYLKMEDSDLITKLLVSEPRFLQLTGSSIAAAFLYSIQTVDISTTRSDMWLFIVFKKTIVGAQI